VILKKKCCHVLFLKIYSVVFEMNYLTTVDRLSLISLLFVSLLLYFMQEIQI